MIMWPKQNQFFLLVACSDGGKRLNTNVALNLLLALVELRLNTYHHLHLSEYHLTTPNFNPPRFSIFGLYFGFSFARG